jgi:hypothetical protein
MINPVETIWVCQDCMLMHANGECDPDRPETEPEPWAELPHADISMGMTDDQHDCGIPYDHPEGRECDCEHIPFSWSSCDGCGSPLGGDRFAMTLFQTDVRKGTNQ